MANSLAELPAIDSVEAVSADRFASEILPRSQPVVMKGLVADWPAVALARQSPERLVGYLKTLDKGLPAEAMEAPAAIGGRFFYGEDLHRFNFVKRKRRISEVLDQLMASRDQPGADCVYIGSAPIQQHLPAFVQDNPAPLPLPILAPRIWIGGQVRVQTHFDPVYNIACVVAGRRRFVVFPPDQLANLYMGPFEHTLAGAVVSLASLEEPDFQRFPKLQAALDTARTAVLEPGDALFLPHFWFHHVTALEPFNLLVNYWWGAQKTGIDNPRNSFLAALLALKDLEGDEKTFWKSMFDHYVFQMDGDPMVEIPEDLQSAFGKMSPEMHARIRKFALGLLNE